jgi:hypothetical protein
LWQSDSDGTKQAGDARDDEPATEGNR